MFTKENNKDIVGLYFDIILVLVILDEEKIEILRKKLKFDFKINYGCIMVIVDNLKKARFMV